MKSFYTRRAAHRFFIPLSTSEADADAHGQVGNPFIYAAFDTVIGEFLKARAGLDPENGPLYTSCVESGCRFHRPILHPETLDAGLHVSQLGKSAVRYEIGLFLPEVDKPAAQGFVIHFFMDRLKQKPAEIPEDVRQALESVRVAS